MSLAGLIPSSLPLQKSSGQDLRSAVLSICSALALFVAVSVTVKFSS